jgi:pilus assembly protein FimV
MSAALLAGIDAWALGLGRLNIQSALGEALRAEIEITSLSEEEAGNLNVKVASAETYRIAGVEYNSVLPTAEITLQRRADGTPYLRVVSDRAVQEPFVDVILEMQSNTGRLVREFTLLFDPPTGGRPATAVAAAAPIIAPAPVPTT